MWKRSASAISRCQKVASVDPKTVHIYTVDIRMLRKPLQYYSTNTFWWILVEAIQYPQRYAPVNDIQQQWNQNHIRQHLFGNEQKMSWWLDYSLIGNVTVWLIDWIQLQNVTESIISTIMLFWYSSTCINKPLYRTP